MILFTQIYSNSSNFTAPAADVSDARPQNEHLKLLKEQNDLAKKNQQTASQESTRRYNEKRAAAVKKVKAKIQNEFGIRTDQQHLIIEGNKLDKLHLSMFKEVQEPGINPFNDLQSKLLTSVLFSLTLSTS